MDDGSNSKKRLDVWLTEKGLASSRTHAQELINAGQVFLTKASQRKELKKASLSVEPEMMEFITVESGAANRFVSRGGLKLEGALAHIQLDIKNLNALDVGISTGGFTDCLLQKGVGSVVGVDVGHGQVHKNLLNEKRLQIFEGINARNLSKEDPVLAVKPSQGFDLAVMDVSFISITLIIPEIVPLLKTNGLLLSLVKPQFEVGIDGLAKGGIVKDVSKYTEVENKIRDLCVSQGLQILDYFSSPILGKDGNNEFFIYAKKI
jgi:23S rRNA (cytidine1920-2'-O)/16S rRNA (cytidine1409-2'-O)-methyltransferase